MHVSFVLALGFGRLRCGVRGTGLPDELTQELKLGEEELPDYEPTCRATGTLITSFLRSSASLTPKTGNQRDLKHLNTKDERQQPLTKPQQSI